MQRGITIRTAAIVALACTGSASAHHSGFSYQTVPVWIEGSVVRFEHINPHTRITLEDKSADGQVRLWVVEGPPQAALDRRGAELHVPKVGDRLRFCGFPYKSAAELSRLWPGVDFSTQRWTELIDGSSPRYVAGHVMVTSEGTKHLWEPHGLLSECMRSSDEPRQSWLSVINSNPSVREAWCTQRDYSAIRLDASLHDFVEEIDRSLAEPCK